LSPAQGDSPEPPKSASFFAEREKLPPELRPIYDGLVDSYRFHATMHHNHPFVSYKVLASLVLDGWRQDAELDGQK
jgi:hypothetical protein